MGVVLVIDDDLTLAERSGKEIGNESTPLGASGNLFTSVLLAEGYIVDNVSFTAFDTTVLDNYDVVIMTSGAKTAAMFDNLPKRTAVVNYTLRGGKTIIEGGEVGYIYRQSGTDRQRSLFPCECSAMFFMGL